MKIPFLTEVNVDMIIRALGYAGILPDAADRDTIRTLSGDTDELGRDKIASLFNYGSGGGGGLVSTTDIYALIDSDATPGAHRNDFILGRYVDTGPLTTWKNRLFSVGFDSTTETASLSWVDSVFGPTTALMGTSAPTPANVSAQIDIGGVKSATKRSAYGRLLGSNAAAKYAEGGSLLTLPGTSLRSYGMLELTCGTGLGANITFRVGDEQFRSGGDATAAVTQDLQLGGFNYGLSSSNLRGFYVGPSFDAGNDSLLIQQVNDAHFNSVGFELRMAQNASGATDYRMLNITTNEPDHFCYYTINGSVTSGAEPFNRYPANLFNSTNSVFSVYGADDNHANFCTALFKSLAPNTTPVGYDIVMIEASDDSVAANSFYFLRARQWNGAAWDTRFSVNNQGNVLADGSFTGGGAGVAELVEPAEPIEVGDVLVVNAASAYVKSSVDADPCVVGVVADKPGVRLNHGGDPDTKTPMTVCGITPVRCTTAIGGAIVPGDLLVATTGGQARKSSAPALPGTIIGKALQGLAKDGDNDSAGKISVLVILQ